MYQFTKTTKLATTNTYPKDITSTGSGKKKMYHPQGVSVPRLREPTNGNTTFTKFHIQQYELQLIVVLHRKHTRLIYIIL